jgi:hypothetical protein
VSFQAFAAMQLSSVFLGYCSITLDDQCLTFQGSMVVPSRAVELESRSQTLKKFWVQSESELVVMKCLMITSTILVGLPLLTHIGLL